MENKNLAIIGASYLQLPLIQKAKNMGYVTHVFAWKANDIGEKEADFFYPISIVEKEQILDVCEKIGICGICSIASDLAIITVNYVANKLGLTANSMECTYKSTNKYLMRQAFKMGGDPSPQCHLVDKTTNLQQLDLSFPAIVKPVDRSGSRGIVKINSNLELKPAIKCAMKESFEDVALVEEYVDGIEYSVEYISHKGIHHFLALTLKYTTGSPHFIETGHLEPAPVSSSLLIKIKMIVEHALDSLGITEGASHSEIKIKDNEEVRIIEIGGRMGGDCIGSDLVQYSTGYDYVRMVIDVATGKAPNFEKVGLPIAVESKFILTEEDLQDFKLLQKEEPDKVLKIVDYHPEKIGKTTDSSNRAGCYIRRV